MIIASLRTELYLPGCSSLKEKRFILKSIKDRLRNKFNVSLCESGFHDKWQRSELSIVTVSNDRRRLDSVVQSIISFIESDHRIVITDIEREYL